MIMVFSGHMDLWELILVELEVGLSFLGAKMHLLLWSWNSDTFSFSRYTQGIPLWEQWHLVCGKCSIVLSIL
jgi:hypothetical protein